MSCILIGIEWRKEERRGKRRGKGEEEEGKIVWIIKFKGKKSWKEV